MKNLPRVMIKTKFSLIMKFILDMLDISPKMCYTIV